MKKIILSFIVCSLLLSTQTVFAQSKKAASKTKKITETSKNSKATDAPKSTTQEEMMQAWQLYMTPNDIHKMIAMSDGDWSGEVTHWMAPDATPMRSKCSAVNKMIMGGRYQTSEFRGEFMGMPFEGMSILAYDNTLRTFISTWIDNMGTGVMVLKGIWDEKTKSITFRGKCVDPTTGKETDVREVFTIVDERSQTMVMYAPTPDGKGEYKTMEIKFAKG